MSSIGRRLFVKLLPFAASMPFVRPTPARSNQAVSELPDGSDTIRVGNDAMPSDLPLFNVAIGARALANAGEFANGNVAVGTDAGVAVTSGFHNTFLGFRAGEEQDATLSETTVVGANAYATNSYQVALGSDAVDNLRMFAGRFVTSIASRRSLFIGRDAGNRTHNGNAIVGVGAVALASVTSADQVTAIGDYAMNEHLTGNNMTAVGSQALRRSKEALDCVAVGSLASSNLESGVGDTSVGHRAMEYAQVARNNTAIGDSALWQYQGQGTTAVGYTVAEYWQSGDANVVIGVAAARGRGTGSQNVFVGGAANFLPRYQPDRISGEGAAAAGDNNVGVGAQALENLLGSDNVGVGRRTGRDLTTANGNTFVGSGAGTGAGQKHTVVNSIGIGQNVVTRSDDQIVIGDESHREVILAGVSLTRSQLLALKALIS